MEESVSCYDSSDQCLTHNIQNDDSPGSRDSCRVSPCQGGGTCESHDGTFTCYCPQDRTGHLCQHLLDTGTRDSEWVAGFSGQTRVSLVLEDHKHQTPKYSVKMRVKPVSGEGVILHSGDTIIALHNGHLQFSYGGAVAPGLVVQSPLPLTLNTWHQVSLQTYHSDLMMQVDSERVEARLDNTKIQTLLESVFIGGVAGSGPASVPGFTGCISDLRLDNKLVSLRSAVETSGVMITETAGLVECEEVTADLMLADQADTDNDDGDDDAFEFSEEDSFRIMNRVSRRLKSEKRTEISFEIKTQDSDGDIIKTVFSDDQQSPDLLSVSLDHGHLVVRLRLGGVEAESRSRSPVATGQWRRVVVERRGGQVLVRLDSVRDIFSVTAGDSSVSLRSRGEYILGGHWTGSIRNLRIKDRLLRRQHIL